MPVGEVTKDVEITNNGRRGPKSKWNPIFQIAVDNPGKWVCAAEPEDEDSLRKAYNNIRSAAYRHQQDFEVGVSTDGSVYVRVK